MPDSVNPLIEDQSIDTYINILDVLFALRELRMGVEHHHLVLSPRTLSGLSLLMSCASNALDYELKRSLKQKVE